MSLKENHLPGLSLFGMISLTILTMADTFSFLRQYDYYTNVQRRSDMYMKNIWSTTGFSVMVLIRALAGWGTFVLSIYPGELWRMDYVDQTYHLPLSIIAFMQFCQLFHYFRGMEIFGIHLIPMLESIEGVY